MHRNADLVAGKSTCRPGTSSWIPAVEGVGRSAVVRRRQLAIRGGLLLLELRPCGAVPRQERIAADPGTGERGVYGDYLQNAEGEDVVAGIRNTVGLQQLERIDKASYLTQTMWGFSRDDVEATFFSTYL